MEKENTPQNSDLKEQTSEKENVINQSQEATGQINPEDPLAIISLGKETITKCENCEYFGTSEEMEVHIINKHEKENVSSLSKTFPMRYPFGHFPQP